MATSGSWFREPPLHDRHRRPPAVKPPDRLGVRDGDLHQLAAPARAPIDAGGLRFERHRVDDQPPAWRERVEARSIDFGRARAAADEDRVRLRQAPQAPAAPRR